MQYERKKYAEIRSIHKLGHATEDDQAELRIDQEREKRENTRSLLKKELAQLLAEEKSDPERKAYLIDELERMHQQDELKLVQYRLNMQEGAELQAKACRSG